MRWRLWRFWTKRDYLEAGELARRVHEEWLNRAMTGRKKYPEIPVRPEVTGGFAPMMSRDGGARLAEQWWEAAFNRMDRLEAPEMRD